MVAKYSEKIANKRKDYIHKITTQLVKDYDVIAIEDLKSSKC
jgi:transposase, IS605 OrfB family, central region